MHFVVVRHTVLGLSLVLLAACTAPPAPYALAPPAKVEAREPDEHAVEPMLAAADVEHATVREAFLTDATPEDNIDSPASWIGPDGKVLLAATAKKTGKLVVYDGESGITLGPKGQFNRPNGIFVADDLVFVVERDNHRVQVLRLPDFSPIGSFGAAELVQPYGLWLRKTGGHRYEVFVTDAYMAGEDAQGEAIVPPLADLGARLRRFEVEIDASAPKLLSRAVGTVGDTSAAGAIRVPESVWGDPAHSRLLIAEEDLPTGTAIRDYKLDGGFAGRTLGLGLFKAQAEGIALWSCPDGSGYWLGTDQFKDRTLFHVFDRVTLEHLGAFVGNTVANTDGIWLQQAGTGRFPSGVFYAVHDDQAVGRFRLARHRLGPEIARHLRRLSPGALPGSRRPPFLFPIWERDAHLPDFEGHPRRGAGRGDGEKFGERRFRAQFGHEKVSSNFGAATPPPWRGWGGPAARGRMTTEPSRRPRHEQCRPDRPVHRGPGRARPLRFVTAASLFDGHDAAINIMRRLIQAQGAEVDPPRPQPQRRGRRARRAAGRRRRASRCRSYQGGHVEYFKYMVDMLRERGAGHIRVFGGGGGTITPEEIARAAGLRRRAHLPPATTACSWASSAMIEDVVARATGARAPADGARARHAGRIDDEIAIGADALRDRGRRVRRSRARAPAQGMAAAPAARRRSSASPAPAAPASRASPTSCCSRFLQRFPRCASRCSPSTRRAGAPAARCSAIASA